MAEAVILGAVVGEALSTLSDIIIRVMKKSSQFRSTLAQLQETITRIKPIFTEIEYLYKVLDRPTQEIHMFIDQLKVAVDLVRKCEHIKWNPYKTYRHSLKLDDQNALLLRFFQIELLQPRDVKELLVAVKDVQERMEKGNSGGWFPLLKSDVIGFDDQLRDLKAMVLKDSMVDDCSVVVVSAGEGWGKTTLVTKLCHDPQIQGKFGRNIYFATISETPNLKVVIKNLLPKNQFDHQLDFTSNEDAVYRWGSFLRGNNSEILLVLDDVWHEFVIRDFRFKLRGYKILVTSRMSFTQFDTYQLQLLNHKDATNLFHHHAFSERGSVRTDIPADLVVELVMCCKRHPLSLTVVGGLLNRTPLNQWRIMLNKLSKAHLSVLDIDYYMRQGLAKSLDMFDEDSESTLLLLKADVIRFEDRVRALKAMVLKGSEVDDGLVVVVSADDKGSGQESGMFDREAMSGSGVVPSTLIDIAPILRVADDVETDNPFVAYLCRFSALEKAHYQDSKSSGPGVRLFKSALLRRLERDQEAAFISRGKETNAIVMLNFHQQYYKKHFEVGQNDDDTSHRAHDHNQTASLLFITFEVLKESLQNKDIVFVDEILQSHIKIVLKIVNYAPDVASQLYDIVKKIQTSAHYKTLDLAMLSYPKILEPPREIVENRERDAPSETLQLEVLDSHEQAMLSSLELNHLKIPLDAINICTQNFNERNYIGKGGYGRVYKGMLSWANHENQPVAVKRLDAAGCQGNKEFYTEVMMLSQYQHENVITLIGFCHYKKEMILVYEYASRGSLDTYIRNPTTSNQLSWPQLLEICVGVASALDYLHNHMAATHRIIHRDIKSANILLDENWNPKLSDFGLSRIGLANQNNSFVVTNFAGTLGYCDPQYLRTGILTKESDVYSFGVVLFEVLCGRLAYVFKYNDERRFLYHLAQTCYKNGEIEKIMDERIKEHSKPRTLSKISSIAYQCLQETRAERPTIAEVLLQLKQAKEIQMEANVIGTSFEHLGT